MCAQRRAVAVRCRSVLEIFEVLTSGGRTRLARGARIAYPQSVRKRESNPMTKLHTAVLFLALASSRADAQINAGAQSPEPGLPFTMTQVATFNLPWRIAFLPDGRMIITEKVGPVWLVTQDGVKTPISNVPAVLYQGQGGMLGVFLSPHYATDHNVYLTYSEPGA